MIRRCGDADVPALLEIVDDAAQAYKGVIPDDCWREPYMPLRELQEEMRDGVRFWAHEEGGVLDGAMGIQDRGEVDLVRHAYVRTARQGRGIGAALLGHLEAMTEKPILIGTWAAAAWAIRFYEKHGYRLLPREQAPALLRRYWSIPERQIAASVVLASADWQA